MSLISIFKNNPTEGLTDGTQVSTGTDYSEPINFTLDASQNETATVKLAIRTNSGYATSGTTTISDNGDTNDRLKLCWTENGTYTDELTTNDSIGAANKIFYCKASSSSEELPRLDRSLSLRVSCVLIAT